jgi:hypothetical protein
MAGNFRVVAGFQLVRWKGDAGVGSREGKRFEQRGIGNVARSAGTSCRACVLAGTGKIGQVVALQFLFEAYQRLAAYFASCYR